MIRARRILPTLFSCWLMSSALDARCSGQEVFPGHLFELRPPHVRISEANESPINPRGGQWFEYFETPPAITPQSDVRLTEEDLLSLVYPASGGSFSSGGSSLIDRLRIDGSELELDVFHFFDPFGVFGDALVPPRENSLFIGQLPASEYLVNTRNWYLSYDMLTGFDPETFEPPSNATTPTLPIFMIPLSSTFALFSVLKTGLRK
jgi:hypothetical protein